jgi:hypothetical protein
MSATSAATKSKFKEVYIDGERYVSDELEAQIKWLKVRSEEIFHGSIDDRASLTKLYQIIGMISVENN